MRPQTLLGCIDALPTHRVSEAQSRVWPDYKAPVCNNRVKSAEN